MDATAVVIVHSLENVDIQMVRGQVDAKKLAMLQKANPNAQVHSLYQPTLGTQLKTRKRKLEISVDKDTVQMPSGFDLEALDVEATTDKENVPKTEPEFYVRIPAEKKKTLVISFQRKRAKT